MRPILDLNCLLQIEQARSDEERSVGDAFALAFRRARLCSASLVLFASITKTRLYNFDPLKPQFYIVKLGFTGVYIIFLISAQNINCGYSLEPPRRGGSN